MSMNFGRPRRRGGRNPVEMKNFLNRVATRFAAACLANMALSAAAETGWKVPGFERVVYAREFGKSMETGLRETEFDLQGERPLGALYIASGAVTVSAKGLDGAWTALTRRDTEGEPTASPADKGYSFWYAPRGFQVAALKVSHDVPADAPADGDGTYSGRVGGMVVFSNRLENIGLLATAFASTGARSAGCVNDGKVNDWSVWSSEPNGRPVSSDNPQWVALAWPAPVTFAAVGLDFALYDTAEIQICVAEGHPKDAPESAWKTVKTVSGLRSWYPLACQTTVFDLDAPATTRGLRLRITAPVDSRLEHPHTVNQSMQGEKVASNEIFVFATEAVAAQVRAAVKAATPPPAGIPVAFEMPVDGAATLVVEDKDGRRVRNLVSAGTFTKGRHVVYWDGSDDLGRDVDAAQHGLYRIPFRPVAPGAYRVRGIAHAPFRAFYEFAVYSPGDPPWPLPDHTGAWLANHSAPSSAMFLPAGDGRAEDRLAFGANITEGPDGLVECDLDANKLTGYKWIGGTWTVAAFLAHDSGANRDTNHLFYVGGLGQDDQRHGELRVTAMGPGRSENRLTRIPLAESGEGAGGLAAHDGLVVASLTDANEVWFTNLVAMTGGRVPVPAPMGAAFDVNGDLLVLSEDKLLKIPAARFAADAQSGEQPGVPFEILARRLDHPVGIALGKDAAYVSCRGDSHQVWVVNLAGRFLRPVGKVLRRIGRAGRPASGRYHEDKMQNPAGICLDSHGRLWVAEQDLLPKRISAWDAKTGKFAKAVYGPPKYGAGGTFDSRDASRFYYSEGGGLLEFLVDWETGGSRLNRVLMRPENDAADKPESGHWAAPERVVYTPGGKRLFTNAWNSDPVSGAPRAALWREEDDRLVFVTAFGTNGCGGVTFADDGTVNVARLPVDSQAAVSARFRPVRHDEAGLPVYDFAKPETIFENARPSGSSGGNQMIVDARGNAFVTAPAGDAPSHSICGGRDGRVTWTYPNLWPGLHAGHSAPRDAPKGRLTAPTRLLSDCVTPTGTDESILALNGNHGEIYFFTTDGLFLDNILEDAAIGRRWNYPPLPRGTELVHLSPSDEHFWPTLNRLPDGKLILVCNKDASAVVRLEGFGTLKRFEAGSVVVKPEDIASVVAAQNDAEASRKALEGTGTLPLVLLEAPPAVDGDLADWSPDDFVVIENRGVRAYFDSNSTPYDIRGALASTKTHLYGAWKTTGARRLAENTGENPVLQFKTGGGLDLMLRTNPDAKGDKPQAGDIRLLASTIDGQPRVMLYEAVVPGVKPEDRVPFTSPVSTVFFDRVTDITERCRLVGGKSGDYELEVPLDAIRFQTEAGRETLGDIGVLRGTDGATLARLYWSNKATAIVSDVPSEAMLVPRNWGAVIIQSKAGAGAITPTRPAGAK